MECCCLTFIICLKCYLANRFSDQFKCVERSQLPNSVRICPLIEHVLIVCLQISPPLIRVLCTFSTPHRIHIHANTETKWVFVWLFGDSIVSARSIFVRKMIFVRIFSLFALYFLLHWRLRIWAESMNKMDWKMNNIATYDKPRYQHEYRKNKTRKCWRFLFVPRTPTPAFFPRLCGNCFDNVWWIYCVCRYVCRTTYSLIKINCSILFIQLPNFYFLVVILFIAFHSSVIGAGSLWKCSMAHASSHKSIQ